MKIIYGKLEEATAGVTCYIITTFNPAPKWSKIRYRHQTSDMLHSIMRSAAIKCDTDSDKPMMASSVNTMNAYFALPTNKLEPAHNNLNPKWAHQKMQKVPNWKMLIDLQMFEDGMLYAKGKSNGHPTYMTFPEPYTTPMRSKQILMILRSLRWENLHLVLLKPLPHQQKRLSAQKAARKQCSQPSVAFDPQPAVHQ